MIQTSHYKILAGTHTLNVNLTITNIHQLEIYGAVLPTSVVCDSRVGFAFSNIYKVRIDGLAFVSCARHGMVQGSVTSTRNGYYTTYYGLHLESVQTAEIIDCTFQDSYGSALGVVDSRVVLRGNNSFLNNCWLCSNGRCDGFYLTPICFGGGVFVDSSNLSINGSITFSGNSAWRGGGVNAKNRSNVYIHDNTTFSGNSATLDGGGVTVWDSSKVYISGNTTFSGNLASEHGGGVSAGGSSSVTISGNTTFSGNIAKYNGGGVETRLRCNVYIRENTTFSGNSAGEDGGGVSAQYSRNMYIGGNTTFSGNSAGRDGGGVRAQYVCTGR